MASAEPVMFASKTPRDLNHDAEPWLCTTAIHPGHRRTPHPRRTAEPCNGTFKEFLPRPQFDHAQHNKPNPILGYVRDRVRGVESAGVRLTEYELLLAALVGEDSESYDLADFAFCDMQAIAAQEHATRVLTLLITAAEGAIA